MTKRKITPHKGGRTEPVKSRMTPEEKDRLFAAKGTLSIADFILEYVRILEHLHETGKCGIHCAFCNNH